MMPSTLDAIAVLDLALANCDSTSARGIVHRATAHLEASLLEYLTGPRPEAVSLTRSTTLHV